jgi:Fe-S cluster assembly protein SufB
MLEKRLESLKIFYSLEMPHYRPHISDLDFDNIVYYAKRKIGSKTYANDWNDVPEEIKSTFLKL